MNRRIDTELRYPGGGSSGGYRIVGRAILVMSEQIRNKIYAVNRNFVLCDSGPRSLSKQQQSHRWHTSADGAALVRVFIDVLRRTPTPDCLSVELRCPLKAQVPRPPFVGNFRNWSDVKFFGSLSQHQAGEQDGRCR